MPTNLTVKSQRILEQLGVAAMLKKGGPARTLTGPMYELRKDPGIYARLAFERDAEGVLNIGYATSDGAGWEIVDSDRFSFRSLGYYERRLRRLGNWVENREVEILS